MAFVDFGTQAGDRRCGGALLCFKLCRIQHCDQVSLFYRRAFVDQQFGNPSSNLRADDDLIGVDRSYQNKIVASRSREEIVERRDGQKHAEQDQKLVANAHE